MEVEEEEEGQRTCTQCLHRWLFPDQRILGSFNAEADSGKGNMGRREEGKKE
jgi:hypothetical protein